jgi:hypothetical protein
VANDALRVSAKPDIWDDRGRDPYLSCFLLIRQVCFGSPAARSAFQDVPVVEQTVEHGGDCSAVAEQFAPVFLRTVGSEQCAASDYAPTWIMLDLYTRAA